LLLQAVTLGLAEESADALAAQVFAFLAEGCLRVDATPFARRRRS